MRVQPHTVGSIVHVLKRGARGLPIVRNNSDRIRFARLLYLLNDTHQDINWKSNSTVQMALFKRPSQWPEPEPLVRILCWVLMSNHFHLLMEELLEGGTAKFMQRVCGSMSAHANAKYGEKGSLFQGGYKGVTVSSDRHLQYLVPYITVKNVFELYPGGLDKARRNFDAAWKWGTQQYAFSSLPEHAGLRDWPLIDKGAINELFPTTSDFIHNAREMLLAQAASSEDVQPLILEDL